MAGPTPDRRDIVRIAEMLSSMANAASEVAATSWGLLPETSLRRLGRNLPCFLCCVLGEVE